MLRNECYVGFWKAGVSEAFCEKLYPLFECRSIDEVIQQLSIVDEQWKQSPRVTRRGVGVPSEWIRCDIGYNCFTIRIR